MSGILESTESALGNPECASSQDLSQDIPIVFSEVLGLLMLSLTPFGVESGLAGFFGGLKESRGNMIQQIACAIYQGSTGTEYGQDKGEVYGFNAIMNAGN